MKEMLFERCKEARIEYQETEDKDARIRFSALFELICDAGYEEEYYKWAY